MKKILFFALFYVFLPYYAFSANYWVSTAGTETTWVNCQNLTDPGSGYCNLATANKNAKGGDTVYLKAGIYDNDGYINPTNSGTSGNYITYQSYGGMATISGQQYAIYISGDNYIQVKNLNFQNCNRYLIINNGDNNVIDGCTFDHTGSSTCSAWAGSWIYNNSEYNVIKNSIFAKYGNCSSGSDQGAILDIGTEESNSDTTQYNLIDNCTMYWGGHYVLKIHSRYNTVRNSFFHNEAWCSYGGEKYGNRSVVIMGATDPNFGIANLFENNRVGYSDAPVDQPGDGVQNFKLAGDNNIIRYNDFFRASTSGIELGTGGAYPVAPSYNYIYNNNFFDNGQDDLGGVDECGLGFNDWGHPGKIQGNVIKNNIFYSNGSPVKAWAFSGVNSSDQIFANNLEESGDPKYANISGSDPASTTNPDFSLQSDSIAIDGGGPLTTVASVINSETLILTDARYFQDGSWGPASEMSADYICIGSVSNCVQISAINYDNNTINTTTAHKGQAGENVWLYSNSSGFQVLYGTAPDLGAHEFVVESTLPNLGPTADAGPDQFVEEGDTVTLDGSASIDPDDGIDSYAWTQTSGTKVTLSDSSAIQPTFTAPDVGSNGEDLTLIFQLTVTDNGSLQDTNSCIITIRENANGAYVSGYDDEGGSGCFISFISR